MSVSVRPFPWGEAMGFAFTVLHMPPQAFWQMTPRELAAAIRFVSGRGQHVPSGRQELVALMAQFPDFSAAREP
jgi:uncharacterized phage protein (TIGR02216 family)